MKEEIRLQSRDIELLIFLGKYKTPLFSPSTDIFVNIIFPSKDK